MCEAHRHTGGSEGQTLKPYTPKIETGHSAITCDDAKLEVNLEGMSPSKVKQLVEFCKRKLIKLTK
ncbi:MAG: hypothetical protein PHG82_05585 [Candidatus Gracilibacteria bacterium]|nr:hypothetical protein [Candidatus Gracilibacteria bacterium]